MPLTAPQVQSWLDRYVAAWRSNDADQIGALFTEDVTYRHRPFADAVIGRDAVVASWLESPDEPDSWEARYEVWSVSEDRAASRGRTEYSDGSVYHNVFLLRFRDGACCEYTEWWVQEADS
jgi:nuclear transport factor 2 (NTF2) superfamily protein